MQLYKIELKSRFYGSKPLFWPSVSIDCRLILKRIKMWFFLKCKVFSQNCAKTLHLNNSKVYTNMLGLRYFWIVQQALINSDFENAVNPHESDVIKAPLQVKAFCLQRSFCIIYGHRIQCWGFCRAQLSAASAFIMPLISSAEQRLW